jgi:hypothetical protein
MNGARIPDAEPTSLLFLIIAAAEFAVLIDRIEPGGTHEIALQINQHQSFSARLPVAAGTRFCRDIGCGARQRPAS